MTYGRILTLARGYARTTTTSVTDSEGYSKIDEAIRQMALDCHGFPIEDYPSVTAKFDLQTHMGFHLTITGSTNNDIDSDIAVTDADAFDQTGTATATELQAQIRAAIGGSADLTVAWSNFAFTIDGIDSTAISVSSPTATGTYDDATDTLFGGTASGTDSLTGGFPEDCTIEADLRSDVMKVHSVWWDYYPLDAGKLDYFVNPETTGDPRYYYVRGKTLRLFPVPTEQKTLHVLGKGVPTIPSSPATDTDIPSEIPTEYQTALAYLVAHEMLLESFEYEPANRMYGKYRSIVSTYINVYGNQQGELSQPRLMPRWYRVET